MPIVQQTQSETTQQLTEQGRKLADAMEQQSKAVCVANWSTCARIVTPWC